MKLNPYAKCVIAALVTALGSVQVANADGRITAAEWITVATATAASLGFVWGVPNADPPPAVTALLPTTAADEPTPAVSVLLPTTAADTPTP